MYDVEANRGPHPSEPIHNAAYPESNYRPGTGTIASSSNQGSSFVGGNSSVQTWQHQDDASDPPPPYVPSAPASSSHLVPTPTPTPARPTLQTSSSSRPHATDGIPLTTLPSLSPCPSASVSAPGMSPAGYLQPERFGQHARIEPDGRPSMQSYKHDDIMTPGIMQSRRRRARRTKFCGVSVGITIAIIIAIGLVVWRNNSNH